MQRFYEDSHRLYKIRKCEWVNFYRSFNSPGSVTAEHLSHKNQCAMFYHKNVHRPESGIFEFLLESTAGHTH